MSTLARRVCAGMVLLAAAAAPADFTAYNDCVNSSTGNVTNYGLGQAGVLKDYATGLDTTVSVSVVDGGVNNNGSGPSSDFAAGTDGASIFGGKVDFKPNVIWYGSSGWYVDLVFTGLTPGMVYELATTNDRGSYTNRWSKITISDADAYTYACSAGAWKVSDSACSILSYNTNNGYVAGWTGIDPGSDLDFTVRFEAASNTPGGEIPLGESQDGVKAYGPGGLMLVEVPEPAGMVLLSLGGLCLLRKRRK